MTRTTSNLETFDFLELLSMLSGNGRTGVLQVYRPDGMFQAWLEGGRVRHLQFGTERGVPALVRLLLDPVGRFHFDEGLRHPGPSLDASVDELALEALDALPVPELNFGGPARLTSPERVAEMRWSLREQDFLRQIEAGRPLSDLAPDPDARRMIAKLARIGLLSERKARVARLTVAVTREVTGVAVVDDLIYRRWQEDLGRHFSHIALREDSGRVVTLPARGGAGLGIQLLLPPELLLRARLRAPASVLVRPA